MGKVSTLGIGVVFLSFSQIASASWIDAGAESISRFAGCTDFEDRFWTEAYNLASEGTAPTVLNELKGQLAQKLWDNHESFISHDASDLVAAQVVRTLDWIAVQAPKLLGAKTKGEIQEVVSAMELGDRTTPMRAVVHVRIRREIDLLKQIIGEHALACLAPIEQIVYPIYRPSEVGGVAVQGSRAVFGTIYQSCRPLELSALTTSERPIEGIRITGQHPAGGNKRVISDRAAVNRTHYYMRNLGALDSGCRDTKLSPPIYDFGGKPDSSANTLNLFANGGSGTEVLGIDCSGYVFSALAVKGLKFKKDSSLKASMVNGLSSGMMANPSANGLSCISRVKFSSGVNLAPGDIIASTGHVVLVNTVQSDPFGLARAKKLADCTTSVLSYRGFRFTITQSSPSQNGVGVNKMNANDYFGGNDKMRTGLQAHAVQACRAKFGMTAVIPSTEAYVVRHIGSADCQAPAIALPGSSCVARCP